MSYVELHTDTPALPADETVQLRGFWQRLANMPSAAAAPKNTTPGGFWQRLADHKAASPAVTGGWQHLAKRADLARYRPRAVHGVVTESIVEGDQEFAVLRSPNGSYLRLTPAEYAIWQAMDGSRTVAQLATMGFLKFQQLLPIAGLVESLRAQHFLVDRPGNIYRHLQAVEANHGIEGWGRQVLRFLAGTEFAIDGIDRFYGGCYQQFARFFFNRFFFLLSVLLIAAGFAAFYLTLTPGTATTVPAQQLLDPDNLLVSLLGFWGVTLISFLVHESAHALAVKHYGRIVRRGGVMLYYGMPAAFVDTSDMWLANRRARIVVSLAGPYADVVLGSLAALALLAAPGAPIAGLLFQLAFACYVTTLFNANPLLELDGYYVLVDWLHLPNLRSRALGFVSGPFWQKLRERAPFSREERIFAMYGAMTLLYTIVAVLLAANFWQLQLRDLSARLLASGPFGVLVALLILLIVVLPILFGLALAAWGLVRGAATWLERRRLARRAGVFAGSCLMLVGLLALLPLRLADPAMLAGSVPAANRLYALLTALLWGLALLTLSAVRHDYRGARVGRALDALLAANALTLLTVLGRSTELALLPGAANGSLALLWIALDTGAFLLLMVAGFVSLLDVDLLQAPTAELLASALLLVLAFVCGGLSLRWLELAEPGLAFATVLLAAAPVYFGVMALALLLPHLLGFKDSRLIWSWALVWLAILLQIGVYVLQIHPATRFLALTYGLTILAAGCWATAWLTHYVTLRRLILREVQWPLQVASSERQRLQAAFRHSYAGCYLLLRRIYGQRRARLFDDRMDVLAATANWDVTLERDQARISPLVTDLPLVEQGQRYAEVLRYTVDSIAVIAGSRFAHRAIQIAYDALPWTERETADRLCFPNTPWARALSRSFGSARDSRLRLLRQVDLFATCDDNELAELAGALRPQQVAAGRVVGNAEPGVWIIEAGEVSVWQDQQVIGELHRGELFGVAILESGIGPEFPPDAKIHGMLETGNQRERSYRCTVNSSLLFLPMDALHQLLARATQHTAEGLDTVRIIGLLERVPLFADLPRSSLRELARQSERLDIGQRQIIVRQGRPGRTFYVIREGRAAVLVRDRSATKTRVIAQLGPGEFFGELELLQNKPPVASIVSLEPMLLLAIPHRILADLLVGSADLAHAMRQVGTGRMAALKARFTPTPLPPPDTG
jgi:putative peptide zinc metalloprotease protein